MTDMPFPPNLQRVAVYDSDEVGVPRVRVVGADGETPSVPATEATLAAIKAQTDKIPASPAQEAGNLATLAGKDFATQTTLAAIKTQTDKIPSDPASDHGVFPVGTGANGSVTLTNASTAYAVPASPPAKNYVLVLYNGSDTDMFWGYANSASNGVLIPAGGVVSLCLGVSQSVYAYCASAGKILSYSYKAVD